MAAAGKGGQTAHGQLSPVAAHGDMREKLVGAQTRASLPPSAPPLASLGNSEGWGGFDRTRAFHHPKKEGAQVRR